MAVAREFSINEVLAEGLAMTLKCFPGFFIACAVTLILGIVFLFTASAFLEIAFGLFSRAFEIAPQFQLQVLQYFVATFAFLIATWTVGVVSTGAMQHLRGEPVIFGPMLNTAMARAGALLPASLAAWLLISAGAALLVVPGIYLAGALALCAPVAVLEREDALDSLKRSMVLTEGYRWQVVGLVVAMALIIFSIGGIAGIALGGSTSLFEIIVILLAYALGPGLKFALGILSAKLALALIQFTLQALALVFFAVTFTVAYRTLREIKEGPFIEAA